MPRPEGSPNKNKQFLMKRLQDMYGEDFHPIMTMAKNAVEFQRLVDSCEKDPDARGADLIDANKLWEGIAQYVEPKLKAIEMNHGIQENNPIAELIKQVSGKTLDPNG